MIRKDDQYIFVCIVRNLGYRRGLAHLLLLNSHPRSQNGCRTLSRFWKRACHGGELGGPVDTRSCPPTPTFPKTGKPTSQFRRTVNYLINNKPHLTRYPPLHKTSTPLRPLRQEARPPLPNCFHTTYSDAAIPHHPKPPSARSPKIPK